MLGQLPHHLGGDELVGLGLLLVLGHALAPAVHLRHVHAARHVAALAGLQGVGEGALMVLLQF